MMTNERRTDFRFHNTYLVVIVIYSFNKYVSNPWSLSGNVIGTRERDTNELNKIPALAELTVEPVCLKLLLLRGVVVSCSGTCADLQIAYPDRLCASAAFSF